MNMDEVDALEHAYAVLAGLGERGVRLASEIGRGIGELLDACEVVGLLDPAPPLDSVMPAG